LQVPSKEEAEKKREKYRRIPKPKTAERFTDVAKKIVTQIKDSQYDVLSSYKYTHCVTGTLGSRMAIGLGGANVQETSITLHHTYACPYIPGSALKGCLRSFVIRDLFDCKESDAEQDADFAKVFGTQGDSGKVFFLDAFPRICNRLDIDIMNPHYPKYYQGAKGPTDDDSPTPIPFYAIPAGTGFTVRLVSKKVDIKGFAIGGKMLTEMLAETLAEMGIGAKTAVGYGWFKVSTE
jgi:CRISPR-associated protein Cmr6